MTDIDPSKVKAGDTVTLERGTAVVRDLVERIEPYPQGGWAISLAEQTPAFLTVTGWTVTGHQPAAQPEWQPGTVYEITTRDDDTIAAWCITGARSGHVVFLDQDGEEYDPSELLAITPQTSVNFTVAALRAEVSKLQTVINITDQAGADILDERNELLAEVERLRDARTLPTRERVESTLSKVLYATPYGELGWAPHRDRWATNAAASDALAALLAPSVFALFEQGGAAQNQDAEGCPDDCGGCACHIAPPCTHCVDHTTDDDA